MKVRRSERMRWICGLMDIRLMTWRLISRGEGRRLHVIWHRSCDLVYMHNYVRGDVSARYRGGYTR